MTTSQRIMKKLYRAARKNDLRRVKKFVKKLQMSKKN